MGLMIGCGALLVVALVLGGRWRNMPFHAPPPIDDPTTRETVRRYAWYCALVIIAGPLAGTPVMGCGGRLAMRLLAVTSGDAVQGRITEQRAVVGEITTGGTIFFVLFFGIVGGIVLAAMYLVIHRLLPPRWIGGLVFGAGVLAVFGSIEDPLRDENVDFDLVNPTWLAVLVFTAMALALGMVLSAFIARLSAALPLPSRAPRVMLSYVPVTLVALAGFSVTAILAAVGTVVVVANRCVPLARAVRSPAVMWVGRGALALVVALALPNTLASITDILSR